MCYCWGWGVGQVPELSLMLCGPSVCENAMPERINLTKGKKHKKGKSELKKQFGRYFKLEKNKARENKKEILETCGQR